MAPKAKEAPKAIETPKQTTKNDKNKRKKVTQSSRIGLVFPVGRIGRHLKEGRYSSMFGKSSSVFMAAVLEYLTCEILELAGNAALESGKKTITPRHLQLAVRNDEELAKLMSATMISNGGYMSNIHPFLLKGKNG